MDVYREYGWTWEAAGYHLDLYEIERAYAAPDAFFDVAIEDGRVIGTIGGTVHGDEAELKRLYTYSSVRRRGVGRALTERFLAWARSRGATRAVLWSDKRLLDAHRLYGKFGFAVMGSRICPGDPDEADEWGMALRLR